MLIGFLIVGTLIAAAAGGYCWGRSDGIKWTHKQYEPKRDYGKEAFELRDSILDDELRIKQLQQEIDNL